MTSEVVAKIDDFLTRAKVFTLSTVDGDRPRARPLGLHMVVNGSVVFGVGDFKDVYRQIVANPKVEITACIGGEWLRLHGRAVRIEDDSVSERALDMVPPLRNIYNDSGISTTTRPAINSRCSASRTRRRSSSTR